MRSSAGVTTLSDISGGTLSSGVVPWGRMLRTQALGELAANVTIGTVMTTILDVDCGTVTTEDRVLIDLQVSAQPVTADRDALFEIVQGAGTAVVQFNNNDTETLEEIGLLLSNPFPRVWNRFAIARVTTGGSLTLRLRGRVEVGTATVVAADTTMACYVMAGA